MQSRGTGVRPMDRTTVAGRVGHPFGWLLANPLVKNGQRQRNGWIHVSGRLLPGWVSVVSFQQWEAFSAGVSSDA